ncbi:unnamed protein product [Boreogadus saida]
MGRYDENALLSVNMCPPCSCAGSVSTLEAAEHSVAVTFVVGSEVGLQSSADFSQMGKPFLMGTVALGGIVNVMPMLFSQISHNKNQILWFRRAVLAGLTTCAVLNILWVKSKFIAEFDLKLPLSVTRM